MLHTSTTFNDLLNRAQKHGETPISDTTMDGYKSDFRVFTAFCEMYQRDALPATSETAGAYFEWLIETGKCVDTVQHHKNAIHRMHADSGYPSPVDNQETRNMFKRLKREHGKPPKKKHALTTDEIKRMISALPDTLIAKRNKAMTLIGFTGALRRGELAKLECKDLKFTEDGMQVTIRQAKTDKTGEGQTVFIPWGKDTNTCPIRALDSWLKAAHIHDGTIFRPLIPSPMGHTPSDKAISGATVARVIKDMAQDVGIDCDNVAGHSLRRGFASEAAKQGASPIWIQHHLRHNQFTTTQGYIEKTSSFGKENPVRKLDL